MNRLLKELPESMVRLIAEYNGDGVFDKVEYDKQLVKERKKRGAWNFDAEINNNESLQVTFD